MCKPFIVSAAVQTHGFYYNYSDHISKEMRSNMDYNLIGKKPYTSTGYIRKRHC